MGASSKKRKARQQAAAQYMSALRGAEAVDDPKRVATGNRRDVQEVGLEDSLDGATRRGLLQLDRIGSRINTEERSGSGLRAAIKSYNDRLEVLNRQLAGEAVTRYVLPGSGGEATSGAPALQQTGLLPAGMNIGTSMSGPIVTGTQSSVSAYPLQPTQLPRNTELFKSFGTEEEAVAALKQKQPNLTDTELRSKIYQATVPSLGGDFLGYKNLPVLEQQYNDLADLTAEVNAAAQSSARNQYVDLANKLNQKVQQAATRSTPQNATGLIGSELAAELDTGVLK